MTFWWRLILGVEFRLERPHRMRKMNLYSKRNYQMKKPIALIGGLIFLAGCQTDVPQTVADSQVPPSAAVKRELVRVLKESDGTIGDFIDPQISSVVLLEPETKTYAFCIRAWHTQRKQHPDVIGFSFRGDRLLGATNNEPRCRDTRLRYYPYPELTAVRGLR
jgi:hypothetical protein